MEGAGALEGEGIRPATATASAASPPRFTCSGERRARGTAGRPRVDSRQATSPRSSSSSRSHSSPSPTAATGEAGVGRGRRGARPAGVSGRRRTPRTRGGGGGGCHSGPWRRAGEGGGAEEGGGSHHRSAGVAREEGAAAARLVSSSPRPHLGRAREERSSVAFASVCCWRRRFLPWNASTVYERQTEFAPPTCTSAIGVSLTPGCMEQCLGG